MSSTASRSFYELVRGAAKGRFEGIQRTYKVEDVLRLRSSVPIEYTLAERGAINLWDSMHKSPFVNALGSVTGNQAMQMVKAGLRSIYLSGWQVAADNNTASSTYPDQSLYPANSGPELCKRMNKALQRADQIEQAEGGAKRDWYVPIVADAEAGFGGPLNCYELMMAYIEAGAAGVHFEDQLSSEKKCGHLGGKVLIPTKTHERNLCAARLAADVAGVPTVLVARTDAESARLVTSDVDERDHEFIDFKKGRTAEGFYPLKPEKAHEYCIKRSLAYSAYADLLWVETSTPNLQQAKALADAIHKEKPNQLFAYNCSPSFNWFQNLSQEDIAAFQKELGKMGFKYQFVTLAGFHQLNYGMFKLAYEYNKDQMMAYARFQQEELAAEPLGYTGGRHQREVGTGYFDLINTATAPSGLSSTTALSGSTETAQFQNPAKPAAKPSVERTAARASG